MPAMSWVSGGPSSTSSSTTAPYVPCSSVVSGWSMQTACARWLKAPTMPKPDNQGPAAPELLGSMNAGGTERFDMQADDPDDTSAFGLNQLFRARWVIRHFGLPSPRAAMKHTIAQ